MNHFNFVEMGFKITMFFVPFLFALCFHEFAHGVIAKMRGDNTAELAGRLSLNPVVHADMWGTWIIPIGSLLLGSPFFFGWAKPVPVNSRNLKNPRWDMFWVAVAGPASNILLAIIGMVLLGLALAFGHSGGVGEALSELLKTFIVVNMFLAIFNLIPVHPLDGGKVIEPFLPIRWSIWLDRNQGTLSMGLFVVILLMGPVLAIPVDFVANLLFRGSVAIAQLIV